MHWIGKIIATLILLMATALPFIGIGVGDRGFTPLDKMIAAAVLIVIALLLLILSRKRSD